MRNILACLIGLLVAIPALAQPIGEWDVFSIHLNGDNDSSISANITFPLGITIPDLTSGTQQIVLGDGSSGSGLTGNGFIYLEDDGFSSRTLNLLGGNSSLNSGVGFILQGGSSTAALASGGGFFLYGGGGGAGGSGGDIQIRGGAAGSSGIGGIVMLRGGTASGGTYGYIRTAQTGTPGHFTLSNVTTRDSLYVVGNLEVDGTTWLDGSTYLASLTGILKGTSGLVATASSSDILAAVDFGTVMLKTDAGVTTFYEPSADTDAARGTALAAAIAAHSAGDTIVVGPGTYDLTDDFTLLAGASLIGVGQPKLYCDDLTDKPLVRLVNSNVRVENIDLETNLAGLGEYSNTPLNISGIILRNVRHTPTKGTDVDGIAFFSSGVTTEHVVSLDAYNCKFYGGGTLGFGSRMTLGDDSIINFWNCDVFGATDGVAHGSPSGTTSPTTNIYGGTYTSVLDAITSQGATSAVINVYGATAHGDQADIYGDDGRVNVYWANARYDYIVGNGINLTNEHPIVGHPVIYDGQLKYAAFGGAVDAGLARLSASTLQVTNGSSTRGDLEVADLAYSESTWDGSFEVPTRNAIRDILEAYTTTGNITISKSAPTLFLTDPANDDWKIDTITGSFRIFNVTDTSIPFLVTSAGAITLGNATAGTTLTRNVPTGASHTWQVNSSNIGTWSSTMFTPVTNITISKATPSLIFTDSGGDDWSATVTAGVFAIRNTTDGVDVFSASSSDNVTINSTTNTLFNIAKALEVTIAANRMTFNNGASDTYLDWTTSGQLEVGGGIFRTTGTAIIQSTAFTPYSSGYELSVQSAGTAAYIEILANTGTGLGSFFGTEVISAGSNVQFSLYNWEGNALGSGNFPILFYGGYGSVELARFDRTGGAVFNDTGIDVDFRVESDTDANNIFSDASANFVGIGTASPGVKLDVAGAIRATTDITSTDTGDLGWAVVDGTDNTACTSQCTNAAVFGLDLAAGATAPVMVGPSSAAADICLCAGAS